jgi:hypothetical protein
VYSLLMVWFRLIGKRGLAAMNTNRRHKGRAP